MESRAVRRRLQDRGRNLKWLGGLASIQKCYFPPGEIRDALVGHRRGNAQPDRLHPVYRDSAWDRTCWSPGVRRGCQIRATNVGRLQRLWPRTVRYLLTSTVTPASGMLKLLEF